jgi:hypothetical protein
MADSAHGLQVGEKALYVAQDGRVLVTDRRLVLGSESWNITEIADVDTVAHKEWRFVFWLKLNRETWTSIVIGGTCFVVGFLFAWLAAGSSGFVTALLVGLALLLYLVGFAFCIRTWLQSLPDLYNLQLTLQDPAGVQKRYEAAYTWKDQLQARAVEEAVLQAVTKK